MNENDQQQNTPVKELITCTRLVVLLLSLLSPLAVSGASPAEELTGFSWERVPVYVHFGKRTADMTGPELDFLAQHYRFVALEKGHGAAAHGSTEEGIYATARELKRRNAHMKVLFYFNAFINWQPYDALKTFNPDWLLRDAAGKVVSHSSGTPRPDPSIPAMREWWAETVAGAMRRAPLDGVFADALPQALTPALTKQLGTAKAEAVRRGLREMLALTKRKIGADKILLANGTRAQDFRQILDWEGVDGVMIEHFGAFQSAQPADLKADLDTIGLAAEKGKFVVLKGWPGFTWLDKAMMEKPPGDLLALARGRIEFPLACYLVAARPGSWFCYSWGYTSQHGMLDAYPEFERPLGPPKGDAVWQGLTATREFAHASVQVDLAAKTAHIRWKNP